MEDWRSAIAMARTVDRVDSKRIALWGSSLSGGHVINLAAEDPTLAAVVAQVPAIDKSAHGISAEAKAKMTREGISVGSLIAVSLRSLAAGIYDEARGRIGLSPHYIAVFGKPGQVAAFTDRKWERHLALFARDPTWRNEFAPRFLFRTPKVVHGTAERIRMPLLVCVAEQDTEANPALAIDIARKARRGVLKTYAARHFDVYTGDVLQQMLSDQTAFLREHLSVGPAVEAPFGQLLNQVRRNRRGCGSPADGAERPCTPQGPSAAAEPCCSGSGGVKSTKEKWRCSRASLDLEM
jgi:pimeloyl-ACP methyl ester carboxylesterase